MRAILGMALALALGIPVNARAEGDSPQLAATRAMHAALKTADYATFYRDWCHPHIQEQLTAAEFVEWMKSEKGAAIARLIADVLAAIDGKAGAEVVVAQAQDKPEQYEYILVQVRKKSPPERKGAQWHLELQLHDGQWKLMDTD